MLFNELAAALCIGLHHPKGNESSEEKKYRAERKWGRVFIYTYHGFLQKLLNKLPSSGSLIPKKII